MKRGGVGGGGRTVSSNVSACREKNVHAAFAIEGVWERGIHSEERNWFGRVSRLKSRRVLGWHTPGRRINRGRKAIFHAWNSNEVAVLLYCDTSGID